MQKPLELSIQDANNSQFVEEIVMEKIFKIEQMYNKIISWRIFIRQPHKRHVKGNAFNIRIDIKLPDDRIVVNCKSNDELGPLIHEAFEVAQRQTKKYIKRRYIKRKMNNEDFWDEG